MMVEAHAFGDGNEDLQRSVSGSGAHAGESAVHPRGALLHGGQRIGHGQREIVVRMHPHFRGLVQHVREGLEPGFDFVPQQGSRGIDDVDAIGAVRFHQLGLPGQLRGRGHVRHHEESRDVHSEAACILDVLLRDVRLGAMRGNAHRSRSGRVGLMQVLDRANAGQQQDRYPGPTDVLRNGGDPFQIGVGPEAVVEARTRQAVSVADLDSVDSGGVECARDLDDLVERVLVAQRVHSVAQSDVLNVEPSSVLHDAPWKRRLARRSPVLSAAEVMMSRLPAYAGR